MLTDVKDLLSLHLLLGRLQSWGDGALAIPPKA